MADLALVNQLTDEQFAEISAMVEGRYTFLRCWDARERLAAEGGQVEIVYGNVRPFELPRLPKLRWVHAPWTGVENLMYPEMVAGEVIVTNTRGHAATAMAEHVIGGLLYLTRGLGAFRDGMRERVWIPDNLRQVVVEDSVALVLGVGAIGRQLARRLAALGVRVWGVNSDGRAMSPCEATFTLETVRPRLGEVRHVVNCLPDTPLTRGWCDEAFFAALAEGATFQNIGRGTTIDHEALLRHLDGGRMLGAVLDVTDPEPPPEDSPLWDHPRLLLTGHRSAFSQRAFGLAYEVFRDNLRCWLDGRADDMRFVVNKQMGY